MIVVVVPVGDDATRLRWCLEGLVQQQNVLLGGEGEVRVVVAEDTKSEESASEILGVLNAIGTRLPLTHRWLESPSEAFRAASARNLGAKEAADGDLLIFLDADCLPDPDFLTGHRLAHEETPQSVAFGFRRNLPEERVTEFEEAAGIDRSLMLPFAPMEPRRSCLPMPPAPSDVWGFSVSMPASSFAAVGGFDETFDGAWGGEDLDLVARVCRSEGLSLTPILNGSFVTHLGHPERSEAKNPQSRVWAAMEGEIPLIANGGPLALATTAGKPGKKKEKQS